MSKNKQTNQKNNQQYHKQDNSFFASIFSKKTRNMRRARNLHQGVFSQFEEVKNDFSNFIVSLNNLRIPVYLKLNLALDNPIFDELLNKIENAIRIKKQIIFGNWSLIWRDENNLVIPVISKTTELMDSVNAVDFTLEGSELSRDVFGYIVAYCDNLFTNENMKLFINQNIVIFNRVDGVKTALYGEGYMYGDV